MKLRTLTLACALLFASYSAFAESSGVCNNALKTICKDTETQRKQRDAYVKKVKSEISAEAETNAAPRIKQMKKEISGIHFLKRMVKTFKIRNQEIMIAAKKRIGGLETAVINPENIALLKSYMNQAIDESQFNPGAKAEFKNTIDSIVIGNFSDFIERTNLDDNVLAQLLSNPCGSDGLVSNAFATTLEDTKYVLICPGFLIGLSQDPDAKERLNTILQAISHEMGHHLDNSKYGNGIYAPYLSCLSNNYSTEFNRSEEDKKFCKKKETSASACNQQVVLSHAGELIADAWGIKVLGIHARREHYSYAETDSLLTHSWANLCGTEDEGIHPTGDFRIGTLLRVNPDISNVLACNNSAMIKPACTLEGTVAL